MPQKSRMRRAKGKAQRHPANVSLQKAKRPPSLSLSFKQPPAAKATTEILRQADYHQRVLAGLQRSLVATGLALVILFAMYYFLG